MKYLFTNFNFQIHSEGDSIAGKGGVHEGGAGHQAEAAGHRVQRDRDGRPTAGQRCWIETGQVLLHTQLRRYG